MLSDKADNYSIGLSQANAGYYTGRENELLRSTRVPSFSVNTRVNSCFKDLTLALDLDRQEGLKIQTWNLGEVQKHKPEGS